MNEEKILKKLNDHDKRFDDHDKRFDDHDKRFDKIEAKLNDHDKKFERVFDKFIELDNKIDSFESNLGSKMDQYQDRILSAIDGVIKQSSDIEIEQLSTRVALDRHQDEINANKKEITKVKKVLKIA